MRALQMLLLQSPTMKQDWKNPERHSNDREYHPADHSSVTQLIAQSKHRRCVRRCYCDGRCER